MGSRIDNYEIIKPIGKGSYGSVYLVKNKDTRKQYVMKKVNLHGMNPKERSSAQKEVTLLQRLNHPNIVTYTESFFDRRGDTLCIVMQFCEGGDLYNRLKSCRGKLLREEQILEWFGQLAGSMAYIHNKRILHRDLKSQNIFLSGNTMQIGDFGIARVLDGTMAMARTIIGTPYYMSPELFENRPYNGKSDVWALGCVLYEITTLKHAFDARDMSGLAMKITRGRYPPISSQYSTALANLIKAMLAKNPRDRPTMQQICQMPLLQGRIPGEDGAVATPAVPRVITPSAAPSSAASDRSHRRPDYIEQQQKLRAQQQQHQQVLVANRPGSGARAGRPPMRPPVAPARPQKPSNNLQHMMQQRARELERAKEDKEKVEGALAKLERERQLRIKEALDRQNRVAAAEKEQQKKHELNAALELNRRRQAERQRLEQQHRERMARIEKEAAEKRLREKADRDARDAAARAAVNSESEKRRKAEEDRRAMIAEAEARKKREERIAAEREKLQSDMKKWEIKAKELEEQKRRKQMERREDEKKKAAREAEERMQAAKNMKKADNDDDALEQLDRIRQHGRVQQEEQRRLVRNAPKGMDDKKLEKLEWIADMHRENESKLKDLKARDRPSASPTPAPALSRPRPALRQSRDAAPSAVERNRSDPVHLDGKEAPSRINRAYSDMDEKLRSQLPLPAYGDRDESSRRNAAIKSKEAVVEEQDAADRLRREYHADGLQSEPSSRRVSPEPEVRRTHSPPERDTPRRRNRSEGGDSDEVEIEMKMKEWSEHTARIEELQEALELTRTMMENNPSDSGSSNDGDEAEEEDGEGVTVEVEDEASLSDTEGEDTDEGEGNSSRMVGNATSDSIIRSRLSDRMEVLRKHCVEGMGRELFEKAYHFMKTTNANVLTDEQEDAAFEEFTRRFGKENQMYMQYIDQLQFLSEAYNAR